MIKMNEPLKCSKFVFLYQRQNKVVLYHSLLIKKIYGDKNLLNLFKEFEKGKSPSKVLNKFKNKEHIKEIIKKLYTEKFLVNDESDEMRILEKIRNNIFDKLELGVSYIIITDACNFRCKYCFIGGKYENFRPKFMSKVIARKAIDVIFKEIKKSKRKYQKLVIYGGEPLLARDILEFIVKEVRRRDKSIKILTVTNGSLVDKKFAKFCKTHKILVSVSLDGPKKINDKMRIDANGKGTFEKIIRGYNILKKEGVNPSISCTVAEHNVEKLEEIMEWMIKKLDIDSIGFNILMGRLFSDMSTKELSEKTSKKLINVFKIARKYGIYEDTTLHQVESFVEEKPYLFNCAACGGQLVIDPNGNIGVCHAFIGSPDYRKHFPKNVGDKEIDLKKTKIFKEWVKRSPVNMTQCLKCPAVGICGGGCPYNAYLNNGSIWSIDEMYCNYAKNILEWLIWDSYDKIKLEK